MFFKRLKVGVDIGASTLKCAAVEGNGKIRALWRQPIMPERTSRDQVWPEEEINRRMISLFKSCPKEIPLLSHPVDTAIEGEGIIYRYQEIPQLSKKEMDIAVPSRAIKYIPFPLDQVNISYMPVPPLNSDEKTNAVFWVAARKELVDKISDSARKWGLQIAQLETPPLALTREFARNHPHLPKENFYALLNVGYGWTQIVVVRNGYPYFAREIPIAGKDFTYAFQMGTQSTWAQAEKYKLGYDVRKRESQVESFLLRWLGEVRKSVFYFTDQISEEKLEIKQIYLSGGSAPWEGLSQRLSEFLSLPVEVDSWDQLTNESEKSTAYLFKTAIGLAFRD